MKNKIIITSVNGGTCNKCGEKNCNAVGPNIHQCKPIKVWKLYSGPLRNWMKNLSKIK